MERGGPRPEGEARHGGDWRGIPGVNLEHVARFRSDRYRHFLGPNGAALTTREFSWERDISPKLDALRQQTESAAVAKIKDSLLESGENSEVDVADLTAIGKTAREQTQFELRSNMAIANLFINNSDRLAVVTNTELPSELENIAGVQHADRYFLIEQGTRQENLRRIFGPLRGLERVKVDDIYHTKEATPGHGDGDFFGWKVMIGGEEFVFLLNSEEAEIADKGETPST
ncbi:MAG: hypothetical protein Q7K39_04465 [Candidatus Magasanikbacteria bacterium]|nr:hypothetical protein [Candidatus Magasanikbacteria bacterium]